MPRLHILLPHDLWFRDLQINYRGDAARTRTPCRDAEDLPLKVSIRMNDTRYTAAAQELRHRVQLPSVRRNSAQLDLHWYGERRSR